MGDIGLCIGAVFHFGHLGYMADQRLENIRIVIRFPALQHHT